MEGCGGGGASGGNNYYNSMSMANMGFGDNNSSSSSSGIGGLSSMAKLMLMTSPPSSATGGDTSNKNHFLPLPWSSTINNSNNSTLLSSINMRDKIMAHPHFPRLLAAYANCQKVGAPPEVVGRLEEACGSAEAMAMRAGASSTTSSLGEDPALDQFMEAYCEMLTKYHQELTKPFKEAMIFLSTIESQFKALTLDHHHHHHHNLHNANNIVSSSDVNVSAGRNGSSSEEADGNDNFIDPQAEDKELKGQLLRRYSGYLGSLKQDFLKKKKKGKLPKEARQQLLEWWSRHYKWPYPSEAQKLALAESTGLDQKQINNWFINQRKRHWKPSEDMQLVVMDAAHNPHYFMDTVMGNPYPMDFMPTPTLL